MALEQSRLYRQTGDTAQGFVAIQQHATFVEIITELAPEEASNITEFAAVVGLVKKCKRVERVFDNAVLWFNDQFLFGNKTNFEGNVTPKPLKGPSHDYISNFTTNGTNYTLNRSGPHPDFLGKNPNRTHNDTTLLKEHDHNDPDDTHDGFVRASDLKERWGGCFIPDGFAVFAGPISSSCNLYQATENTVLNRTINFKLREQSCDEDDIENEDEVRNCALAHVGGGYDTQRNNVGFILGEDGNPIPPRERCGPVPDEILRQAIAQDNECQCIFAYLGSLFVTDPNDHRWIVDAYRGQAGAVSGLPLAVVHIQVDPKNPDRQGFPDEAIWAYREDGRMRLGMPYNENPPGYNRNLDGSPNTARDGVAEYCHDRATVDAKPRWGPYAGDTQYPVSSDQSVYNASPGASPPIGDDARHAERPWAPYPTWNLYNHTGNTVACSIEYNFLGAIDFRIFGTGGGGAEHGTGGADDSTQAWQGNSHPHNPADCQSAGWDAYGGTYGNEPVPSHADQAPCPSGPQHSHNSATVDIYFMHQAPFFTMENAYWDEFGGPVDPMFRCVGTPRTYIVCDKRADEFFHLHDGSETVVPS